MNATHTLPTCILAFDTSGEMLSIALSCDEGQGEPRIATYEGAGAAQASKDLLSTIQRLLQEAGKTIKDVGLIVFGSGPGAFTGLRCSASCAQGLAFGLAIPVLPVSTLLCAAEDARHRYWGDSPFGQLAVRLDARMNEVYTADFKFTYTPQGIHWESLTDARLVDAPTAIASVGEKNAMVVGNIASAYAALPTAHALLRLAPHLWQLGMACAPEEALPHYVRNHVAQTTAERMAEKSQKKYHAI